MITIMLKKFHPTMLLYSLSMCIAVWWFFICTSSWSEYKILIFSITIVYSFIGILKHKLAKNYNLQKLYHFFSEKHILLIVSYLNLEFLHKINSNLNSLFLNIFMITIVSFFIFLINSNHILIFFTFINVFFLGYLGVILENSWILSLSIVALINFFSFDVITQKFTVPRGLLEAVGFAFLSIFIANSIE